MRAHSCVGPGSRVHAHVWGLCRVRACAFLHMRLRPCVRVCERPAWARLCTRVRVQGLQCARVCLSPCVCGRVCVSVRLSVRPSALHAAPASGLVHGGRAPSWHRHGGRLQVRKGETPPRRGSTRRLLPACLGCWGLLRVGLHCWGARWPLFSEAVGVTPVLAPVSWRSCGKAGLWGHMHSPDKA